MGRASRTSRSAELRRTTTRRETVTDRQRAEAILALASGNEEVVYDSKIDRVLRTMASNYVVRVRRTPEGRSVYRVTRAGQRWALDQLASSPIHSTRAGNLTRKNGSDPVIEERPDGDWRAVDYPRRVRTPWLASAARTSIIERAAKMAVRRTDPAKLVAHRHTRDADWIVVHSL